MAERSIDDERGLFGPDSVIWRVDQETVIALGGTCATLMQIAHPAVAAGVRDHSHYEVDLAGRLRRTMDLSLALVFGTRGAAAQAARVINARHREVRGPGYSAMDPGLLLWVHATLVYSALRAYDAFVAPLRDDEADRYYQDTKVVGVMLGIPPASFPVRLRELDAYVDEMVQRGPIEVGDDARRIARLLLYPRLPKIPTAAFAPVRVLTAGLLPEPLRDAYRLKWGRPQQTAFRFYGRAFRTAVPFLPKRVRHMPGARAARRRLRLQPA